MRWTATTVCFFIVANLLPYAANAQGGRGAPTTANNSGPSVCASLRGGTAGLFGLCQAYCAPRDQSSVDMNDIASVRAAAPSVKLLERYNALKTEDDPGMPCFAEAGSDVPPDEIPAPTSCACWTSEQVGLIDGFLDPVRDMTPGASCVLNDSDLGIYEAQIYEGYNVGTTNETVVNSAFAYFDLDDASSQGCMSDSPSNGILNFTLEDRAEAQYCIQTIVEQCDLISQ